MSTHSTIAVHTNEGYQTIYCHFDGYPSYMYWMLSDWYGTEERARALVSFGDASIIDKRLTPSQDSHHSFDTPEEDVCIFYHRDRGESWRDTKPQLCTKLEALDLQYYTYVFEDGRWRAYAGRQEILITELTNY